MLYQWIFSSLAFAAPHCEFSQAHLLMQDHEQTTIKIWTESQDTLRLDAPSLQPLFNLDEFRLWVRGRTPTDPYFLLQRQRQIFLEAFGPEAVLRYDLILERRLGSIHPTTCLEALLLNDHLLTQNNLQIPTEFQAFVLTKEPEHLVRVYFLSGPELSAPSLGSVESQIKNDIVAGWLARVHLHNHPFIFNNPRGDIAGTLIPSGDRQSADVYSYLQWQKEIGLQEAWITNGFDTIKILADEFNSL